MSTFVVLDGKTIGKHMATKLLKNKISQFKSTADSTLVKKRGNYGTIQIYIK